MDTVKRIDIFPVKKYELLLHSLHSNYLNDPWLEFAIQENIKSKDFKTCTAFVMIWETCPVVVLQYWVGSDKRLDYYILQKET